MLVYISPPTVNCSSQVLKDNVYFFMSACVCFNIITSFIFTVCVYVCMCVCVFICEYVT